MRFDRVQILNVEYFLLNLVRISGLEPISLKDPFWDVDLCDLYSDLQEIESNQLDNILSNHSRVLGTNLLAFRFCTPDPLLSSS